MSSSYFQDDDEEEEVVVASIHDLLALGEIKSALNTKLFSEQVLHDKTNYHSENDNATKSRKGGIIMSDSKRNSEISLRQSKRDRVLRLPLLLRLLSMLQPLSSVPSIRLPSISDNEEHTTSEKETCDDEEDHQNKIDQVVALLEKVAASFPAAEGADVLTYYLAPEACRKVSRCLALTRKRKINFSQDCSDKNKNENNDDDNNHQVSSNSSNSDKRNNDTDADRKKNISEQNLVISTFWNTTSLENIAKKKTGRSKTSDNNEERRNSEDDMVGIEEHVDEAVEGNDSQATIASIAGNTDNDLSVSGNRMLARLLPKKRRKTDHGKILLSSASSSLFAAAQESSSAAAEDSQESAVEKILAEVISLTLSGLEPIKLRIVHLDKNLDTNKSEDNSIHSHRISSSTSAVEQQQKNIQDDEEKHSVDGTKADDDAEEEDRSGVVISVKPDSLLAERPATTGTDDIFGSWNSGNDMTATVPTLLHYAPVLRYEHLANALCRSAVPQCISILIRMAANCPASSACVVRGCLKAYEAAMALISSNSCPNSIKSAHSIIKCCKSSIKGISNLSKRESCLVCCALINHGEELKIKIPDILLETMITYDKEGAVMIMLKELLSFFKNTFGEKKKRQ